MPRPRSRNSVSDKHPVSLGQYVIACANNIEYFTHYRCGSKKQEELAATIIRFCKTHQVLWQGKFLNEITGPVIDTFIKRTVMDRITERDAGRPHAGEGDADEGDASEGANVVTLTAELAGLPKLHQENIDGLVLPFEEEAYKTQPVDVDAARLKLKVAAVEKLAEADAKATRRADRKKKRGDEDNGGGSDGSDSDGSKAGSPSSKKPRKSVAVLTAEASLAQSVAEGKQAEVDLRTLEFEREKHQDQVKATKEAAATAEAALAAAQRRDPMEVLEKETEAARKMQKDGTITEDQCAQLSTTAFQKYQATLQQ